MGTKESAEPVRSVVVTGAARGIGLGIARRFEREGYQVAAWDIDLSTLENEPPFAHSMEVDVSSPESVEQALESTLSALGGIDVLVNNAGVSGPTVPAWEYPIADWDRVLAVDLIGVFICSRAVIPHLSAPA